MLTQASRSRNYTSGAPPPPTSAAMDDRKRTVDSEEEKKEEARLQKMRVLQRWAALEKIWIDEEAERKEREGGKEEEARRRQVERDAGELEETDVDEEAYALELEQLQHAAGSSSNPAFGVGKKK
jgi:hypothetical protein